MSDKYLIKEKVIKRYNSINDFIIGGRNIGLAYGIAFFTLSLGQTPEQLLAGGTLAVGSYYTGNFFSKLTQKRKEKLLNIIQNNEKEALENRIAA
ncbi:MAG: hypothetical protein ACP5NZ_04635 [Nanobdellota archaeon]